MKPITEREFSWRVEELLKIYGWKFYHVVDQRHYARRTTKGFPDYTAAKEPRLVFFELKSEKGKLTPEQKKWIDLLIACGQEVYIWKPSQMEEVIKTLGR